MHAIFNSATLLHDILCTVVLIKNVRKVSVWFAES